MFARGSRKHVTLPHVFDALAHDEQVLTHRYWTEDLAITTVERRSATPSAIATRWLGVLDRATVLCIVYNS